MRCFLQIVELSHKQVQKTEQMEKNRNQAVRHDQETKIPTIETISKIQNTIPISETMKTQIDNTVAIGKQVANLPAKQNDMKLDNPITTAIISGFNVYPKPTKTCPNWNTSEKNSLIQINWCYSNN